jgi:hypothetical protein
MEHFYWRLKAAIMYHMDQQCKEALSMVLLGICTLYKADMQASIPELTHGKPLGLCGKPATMQADEVKLAYILKEAHCWITNFIPLSNATRHRTTDHNAATASYPDYILPSYLLPCMLQHLRNHIHWGEAGDVETSYKAVLL